MNRRMLSSCGVLLALTLCASNVRADFALKDEAGKHLDVLQDGKVVARYMYAYDKANLADTYKPYLHVFDAEGKAPITKGPGGQFTHHRGIFIGWNKITYKGKSYDRWHMKGGEIVHQKFLDQKADADGASFTSVTQWNDDKGAPFVEEHRTMSFKAAPAPARLVIDFSSTIKPVGGDVKLDGDPEHAGIHYRPAEKVSKTTYVFPKEGAQPTKDVDYPWVGLSYTLDGGRGQHSVVHINHPDNPKETRYSAYRGYGRFGAFPVAEIKDGGERAFKYRFVIATGEMPDAALIQKLADEFTGAPDPTPAPKTTVLPGK
jgi:hypothetical protein